MNNGVAIIVPQFPRSSIYQYLVNMNIGCTLIFLNPNLMDWGCQSRLYLSLISAVMRIDDPSPSPYYNGDILEYTVMLSKYVLYRSYL